MFHFMILVWAQTHVTEDYPEYVPHPLEETYTDEVVKKLAVLNRISGSNNLTTCLNY